MSPALSTQPVLLTSVQLAHFVSHGCLRFDAVVPDELNREALDVLAAGIEPVPYGTPVDDAYPVGSFPRRLLELPVIAGAVRSLVGPDPTVDHHFFHVRRPHEGRAQDLHADAIIDVRPDAFDIQLMYYPHEVTLEMGGTLTVPGTHLRRINESSIGRYQNIRGQQRLVCPAGTVVVLHHGIWHSGRRNDSDRLRSMYKIRLNPTVPQQRLWDTADLDDPRVSAELATVFPWTGEADGRLEVTNRIRLWRHLSGREDFDIDYWLTRVSNRPAFHGPGR